MIQRSHQNTWMWETTTRLLLLFHFFFLFKGRNYFKKLGYENCSRQTVEIHDHRSSTLEAHDFE